MKKKSLLYPATSRMVHTRKACFKFQPIIEPENYKSVAADVKCINEIMISPFNNISLHLPLFYHHH